MDSEPLDVRTVTPDARPTGAKPSAEHYQATSPTTGQTRPHHAADKGGGAEGKSERERETSDGSEGSEERAHVPATMPKELFPLPGFLRTLLAQEKTLWERNEFLLNSLKCE